MHPVITLLATAFTLALILPFSQSCGFYDWNDEEGPLDEERDPDNAQQEDDFTDG
jgi:hypothetical protein